MAVFREFDLDFESFFREDEYNKNAFYFLQLPSDIVECELKIKSDLLLCGLPFFIHAFEYLNSGIELTDGIEGLLENEGKYFKKGESLHLKLPFNVALTGERVALNLLQRASSVATYTQKFVNKAYEISQGKIKILDTRKTTPGLRSLEKYAVRIGGGHNHRFSQSDAWMIKDNHKSFFGGLEGAWNFFQETKTYYQNTIVEIHSLEELKKAQSLGVRLFLLDNFSKEDLKQAISLKRSGDSFEVSGGVNLQNLNDYLIEGIDAVSVGALTHSAPQVDLSLKMKGCKVL